LTVATEGVAVDQVPPVPLVVKSDVPDAHKVASPVIAGTGNTVATTDRVQPVAAVYTMVEVPGANPVSTPPLLLMDAVNIAEEFHTIPGPVADRVDVPPSQTVRLPVTGPGRSSMVMFLVV
jgi:hypothetical protein